jgi:hypothetical protein
MRADVMRCACAADGWCGGFKRGAWDDEGPIDRSSTSIMRQRMQTHTDVRMVAQVCSSSVVAAYGTCIGEHTRGENLKVASTMRGRVESIFHRSRARAPDRFVCA